MMSFNIRTGTGNFALGTGDQSDKAFPDHINLLTQAQAAGRSDPSQKFSHVGVQDVVMSKLHTGVITSESRGNLSLCGFGANGRLGKSIHSQLALVPMTDLQHSIVSIALGQDHTLALTSGGYILSWGHNRFSQLGYVIEAPEKPAGMGKEGDDLIQVSPKRIVGPLKKNLSEVSQRVGWPALVGQQMRSGPGALMLVTWDMTRHRTLFRQCQDE